MVRDLERADTVKILQQTGGSLLKSLQCFLDLAPKVKEVKAEIN